MFEGNSLYSTENLLALADALRTPLLRLNLESSTTDPRRIQTLTEHALRDIDALMEAFSTNRQVQFETLSLGALMGDTSQKVKHYAEISGVNISVEDHARHQPVFANSRALGIGLELMLKTMCDLPQDTPEPTVVMRADTRHGYPRIGVYRDDVDLTAQDLVLAKKLIGGTKVNAGVFQQLGALRVHLANRLLEPFSLHVRTARSDGFRGLAVCVLPSYQVGMFAE